MTDLLLAPARDRTAIRRSVRLPCEAVSLDRYRILGRTVRDVSATGMLLAADEPAHENEIVLVHLLGGKLVAEAQVTRIVAGARRSDRGPALGLRFSRVSHKALRELLHGLRGTPPPVPSRRVRPDYAATVLSTWGRGAG